MAFLVIYPDGTSRQATAVESWLEDLFNGAKAIRPDGREYVATRFLGGILLDGCPLNVILGGGWLPGQIDALRAVGMTQCLPKEPPPPAATTFDPIKARPQDIGPSLTPPPMGQALTYQPVTDTPGNLEIKMGTVYRMLLQESNGTVNSGATYPGCSRSNPDGCKPISFANMDDAVFYSKGHNEVPVRVHDAEEAWAIVEGRIPVSESSIFSGLDISPTMIAVGLAALFMLTRKKGR